ncbi:SRPBCC family protein [Oceanihabitans sp. 2_MG-2023]|uniref:SRPBCC family protein n=1 Tax=Oceanihabitans sp. 2_MG-2023 TaxID=3062661 RepID=UPI0026E319AC|nr:SRPBCC family protein [Oceanihabitans sp. 2_MG-2023]MDO6597734.1 SRPBCC family protein [Oceanihabitans sp. 2_MG-2023]
MKYTTEIVVKIPLEECIAILNHTANLKHWQKDLTSYEHISGTPGTIGNKMKLNYNINNRKIELTETIMHINLPHEIYFSYETKGILNTQKNHFFATPEGHTKWINENEFSSTSFLTRIMLILMPRAFKKQSKKYLTDFKTFAENKTPI